MWTSSDTPQITHFPWMLAITTLLPPKIPIQGEGRQCQPFEMLVVANLGTEAISEREWTPEEIERRRERTLKMNLASTCRRVAHDASVVNKIRPS